MNKEFKIIISSDNDYEDLCAEIYFNEEFVGIIDQELGFENLRIELYPPKHKKFWSFKFVEFEIALKQAKETLWKMKK